MTWVYDKVEIKFLNILNLQQLEEHLKSDFLLAMISSSYK